MPAGQKKRRAVLFPLESLSTQDRKLIALLPQAFFGFMTISEPLQGVSKQIAARMGSRTPA